MNKRILLAVLFAFAGAGGCKKEIPNITEAQAYSIAEIEFQKVCGMEGSGKCTDFLYKGMFSPAETRFKWSFHFLNTLQMPMSLIIVDVDAKGDPATGFKKLGESDDLSMYKEKGNPVALAGTSSASAKPGEGGGPPGTPATTGKPATPAAPGAPAAPATPATAGKPAEGAKPGATSAKPAEGGKPAAPTVSTAPATAATAAASAVSTAPAVAATAAGGKTPSPLKPPATPAAVGLSTKTTPGSPTTIEEMYTAGVLRNPFIRIEAAASVVKGVEGGVPGLIPDGEFSLASLELKGVLDDRSGGFAILVDPKFAASFVLKRGRLFDIKNKEVPGVRGSVKAKQRSVELIGKDKEKVTLTMAEPSEDGDAAPTSGSTPSGPPPGAQ